MASKQKIDNVYVADGLAEDCEELILKCSLVSKLSFEKFSDIWREMEFASIFHGRPSGAELAEFSEEALHIAKYFMVTNVIKDFEKSVAGLFLVYGILNLQPFPRLATLRLVQEDVAAIKKLEFVARRERRHDILYILGDVLIRGPCQFHVSARERGLDFCIRKYYDGYTQHSMVGKRPTGVFHRHNEELDIIRELNYLEDRYEKAKKNISGPEPDRSLNYANNKLAKDLQGTLKTVVAGIILQDNHNRSDDGKDKQLDHYDSVQAIKHKAMKTAVDPMKHLTGVDDRNQKQEATTKSKTKKSKEYMKLLENPRKPKSPIKSPKPYPWSLKLFNEFDEDGTSNHKPYKNVQRTSPRAKKTSESPKNPDPGLSFIDLEPIETTNNNNSPPKTPQRRSPRKNATPKRARLDIMPSSDDSSDEEPLTKKIPPKHRVKKAKKSKTTENNPTLTDNTQFQTATENVSTIKNNTEYQKTTENVLTLTNNTESHYLELNIDEIPIEFSTENNNVEIEIIDLYKGKKDKKTIKFENEKKVEIKSKAKIVKISRDIVPNEPSTSKTNEKSSKPLRKHMKLPKLKSRMKRLGVDQVVNFEDGDSSD